MPAAFAFAISFANCSGETRENTCGVYPATLFSSPY
jgi:hypothetical protein